jgi:hypothetical protein
MLSCDAEVAIGILTPGKIICRFHLSRLLHFIHYLTNYLYISLKVNKVSLVVSNKIVIIFGSSPKSFGFGLGLAGELLKYYLLRLF